MDGGMPAYFTKIEVEKLVNAIEDDLSRVFVTLVLETGLRSGELRALRWRDVDLASCRASIRATMMRANPSISVGTLEPREIDLSAVAVDALVSWRRQTRGGPDDFVISGRSSGRPASPDLLRWRLQQAARAAGIDLRGRGAYALRNTFTVAAVERGESLTWIAPQLGSRVFPTPAWLRFIHVEPSAARREGDDDGSR